MLAQNDIHKDNCFVRLSPCSRRECMKSFLTLKGNEYIYTKLKPLNNDRTEFYKVIRGEYQ